MQVMKMRQRAEKLKFILTLDSINQNILNENIKVERN
jgi:hypothetical protein